MKLNFIPGTFDDAKGEMPLAMPGEENAPQLKKVRCDYVLDEEMIQEAESSEALKFIRAVMEVGKLIKDDEGERRCVELVKEFGKNGGRVTENWILLLVYNSNLVLIM